MSSQAPPPSNTPEPDSAKSHVGRRRTSTARIVKFGGLAVLVFCVCGFAGFLGFAEKVVEMRVPSPSATADAIVVLTGGQQRIEQAVGLLRSGAAHRLFISGVNPSTTSNEIRRLTKSSKSLFDCCVDIGHDAIDTIGNAYETARWIGTKGYRRVFLVTNNYHMPRSLLELRRVDPRTVFVPYPVINNDLKSHNWLHQPAVMRRLVSEYVKYSLASIRQIVGGATGTGLRTDHAQKESVRLVKRSEQD